MRGLRVSANDFAVNVLVGLYFLDKILNYQVTRFYVFTSERDYYVRVFHCLSNMASF